MNVKSQKAFLRGEVRERLRAISAEQCASASALACSLLERQDVWKKAHGILFYAPLPDELNIEPLVQGSLAVGKIVALPRFDSATKKYVACQIQNFMTDIRPGQFGIREPGDHCVPVPLSEVDLVLVPGVAFDLRGHRLGRGKGFYDQLLTLVRGTTCGVAFDEQIVDQIPVESHDVRLNCLLTPTRWIEV